MRDQKLWTWHVAAGVLVLVLLGLHMVIMHLTRTVGIGNPAGGHAVDWGNVVARGKSLFFTLTYILLLGAALFHGLYGLRNIVCELGPSAGLKKAINALLLVGGLGLFGLGTWAAIASFQLASSL
jgi:succinate dehydrogenase / fumarate reductase membrane anchor subunit